jgi:MarR family transcriptional regulator for hemolysin
MKNQESKTLGFLVSDVARLLRFDFDRRSRKLGLSRSQWSVLARLSIRSGIQQKELADLMDIKPITLTRHLDRLESEGWIERRNHPNDRRANNVYLTEKGKSVIGNLRKIGQNVREKALSGINNKEEARLLEMLALIRDNLSN